MPGSIPREKRSGSSAGVVGALPGRSLGRPAPRGRGLGPQSRAQRLYFQGPVFSPSPDLRREGIVFLRRDHDPETSDSRTSCSSSSSSSAQSMLQPTVYNVTTLPRPAAGNTMRVTDLRCTAVSSCFGKHLRFITHRIYGYQAFRGCCSASAKSTLQPASQSRPAAAGNAMHVW